MITINGEENDVKRSQSSSLLHKSKSLLRSKYEILIKYTLVPSIPLSIIAILSINPNTWMTSEIHHFYIELFAVILAAVLAFYYIARARALNDKFSLFIGIGFLTSALIDLLHVIVAYVAIDNPIFLKYFIPQTWFAGRIFLSAMLVMAIVKFSSLSSSDFEVQEKGGRNKEEEEQKPGLINLRKTVTIYFYKNELYKRKDAFYKGLLGYLIVDIFAQIIMSYSAISFDTAHNVAHVLKDAGYFVNIIALALSSIQYNARLRQSNDRLKEREETIRVQYEKLKESDKIKDEFINVAAHELRTPIQPILSLTEVLRSKIKDIQQLELLDIIIRNAKRSQQLTNDILDVTKIESHSLNLKKEPFNLNDIITNVIDDIMTNRDPLRWSQKNDNKEIMKISYQPQHIFVEADKARITQVISN